MNPKEPNLLELIAAAEAIARRYADGHITLLRFTTNHWKAMLGTVDADFERVRVSAAPMYPTLAAALRGLVATVGGIGTPELLKAVAKWGDE
jgi:hypothetical protein